jgi:hypothetical protein
VLAVWAIWSAGILALAAAAATLPGQKAGPWSPEIARAAPAIARFDAGWYYDVAARGYHYDASAEANNVRFYPLYPLLMRGLREAFGIPLFEAGIAISLASLLLALLLLGSILEARSGPGAVVPGIAVLLFFPTAFYFASVYTESLFLLATVAAFWAARKGSWSVAALAGFAAGLTRLNGVLIVLPVAWCAWEAARRDWRALRSRVLFAVTAPVVGAALYPLYLWRAFGSPLLFFHAGGPQWAQRPAPPWALAQTGAQGTLELLASVAALALFLTLTAFLFLRRETPEALYAAATLAMLLSSGTLEGLPRYVLPLFPCFLLLADFLRSRPVLAFAYVLGGVGFLVFFLVRFVGWRWVT